MNAKIPTIGNVSTQPYTISRATPHRTADIRRVEPIPRMDDVMTWVVLTGIPVRDANSITDAAAASAEKPWGDLMVTIRTPNV